MEEGWQTPCEIPAKMAYEKADYAPEKCGCGWLAGGVGGAAGASAEEERCLLVEARAAGHSPPPVAAAVVERVSACGNRQERRKESRKFCTIRDSFAAPNYLVFLCVMFSLMCTYRRREEETVEGRGDGTRSGRPSAGVRYLQ